MKVSIQEAKRTLADLLDSALHGDEVVITRDGRPVARLVPLADPASSVVDTVGLPPTEQILRNRTRLEGITVAELLAESRRDLP